MLWTEVLPLQNGVEGLSTIKETFGFEIKGFGLFGFRVYGV